METKYYDSEGKLYTLEWLIEHEPALVASRYRAMEYVVNTQVKKTAKADAERDRLREALDKLERRCRAGSVDEWSLTAMADIAKDALTPDDAKG